jgi:hypothetical protein
MYLSGSQIRRERTGHHAQSSKEGPSTRRKKKKKVALTVDRKKERLSDKMKKVPLDEIKLQRSPTSTTNGATRYDELAGGVGSAHQKVENPDST